MTYLSSQVHMRHWGGLMSISASPKHSIDRSCDWTQNTYTVSLTNTDTHTHTSMHKHSRALVNNLYLTAHHIVMHPFISAAAEQTVERWEASLQGWQKVLIHERASERHNYRCLHIYKEIPEDIPSQTFQKSLLSFLSPSRSRLECRIKK